MVGILVILLVAGLAVFVLLFALSSLIPRAHERKRAPRSKTERKNRSALVTLVRQCHGDEALAFRLLRGQLERAPGIDNEEAARRAVKALARDRR